MTAPMRGDLRPTVNRFRWGAAEVVTILDGAIRRDAIKPPFCLDKDADEIEAIGRQADIPGDRMEHIFVPTLINTGAALVLFDTGFGAAGHENGTGQLVARMAEAGYAPGDVDVVAFTHCHPDHIHGVMTGDDLTFPNARHVIGRREFDEWKSGDNIPQARAGNRELFLNTMVPLADRLEYLEDGDAVVPGITAEAAFGHSPGHMMFRLESAGQQLLVWGDVANHYVFSLRHPDSPVGFDDVPQTAIATRRRVLDMAATDGLLVVGHHMPFPSAGYVERTGESYRWEAMTYQARV